MAIVTDKKTLDFLNSNFSSGSRRNETTELDELLKNTKYLQPESALQVGVKSALRSVPEMIANVMLKTGLTTPEIIQKALPTTEEYRAGLEAHPNSALIGNLVGGSPLFRATSSAFRAIPGISRAFESAAPSLLKRSALGAAEGSGLGALYAPPEKEGEAALGGGLLGALIHGPVTSIARNMPKIKKNIANISNIEQLKSRMDESQIANEEQQSLIQSILSKNKEEGTGLQSPEDITRHISEKQSQINELSPNTAIPEQPTEHLLNYPEGEKLVPNALKEKENIIKEKQDYLGHGTKIDTEIANVVKETIDKTKKYIQKKFYKPVDDYAKNNYIELPKTESIKEIESTLHEMINEQDFMLSGEFKDLKKSVENQYSGRTLVKAKDFLDTYKETKQAAATANRKGYAEGGENQVYWQKKAEELKNLADMQLDVLKNNLPKEHYEKLATANKLWREQIIPMYGNKIYEEAKRLERISFGTNIMNEVRGEGMGQKQMRDLFLKNPKLTRLAIGHTYSENPEKLLNANPYELDFIHKLPKLMELRNKLSSANRNIKIAERQHELAKENRSRTETGHQEIVKQQAIRQHAISKTKELTKEIDLLEEKKDQLTKEFNKGDITKKQYDDHRKEYDEAIKNKHDFIRKLKTVIKYGALLYGGEKVFRLMTK